MIKHTTDEGQIFYLTDAGRVVDSVAKDAETWPDAKAFFLHMGATANYMIAFYGLGEGFDIDIECDSPLWHDIADLLAMHHKYKAYTRDCWGSDD